MNSFESQRQDHNSSSLKRRWQQQENRRFPNMMINTSSSRFTAVAPQIPPHHHQHHYSSSFSAPSLILSSISNPTNYINNNSTNTAATKVSQRFPCSLDDHDDVDDLLSSVVPPVTVVLEGRSICQRISLHKHASYHSLAKALRQMFVELAGNDVVDGSSDVVTSENELDLSNAVPGHLIAYEDMENDLLLAGDLNWKDFVRVAKRIRILPAKGNSRKGSVDGRHS